MFIRPAQIAPDRHAERGDERGARVAGAVAVVLALRAEEESIQPWYWRIVPKRSRRPVKILCT